MENDDEEDIPLAVPITSSHQFPTEATGITIITGFLGAGKSTLVNYVLTARHGKRIAVILNEFGDELGIERAMINERDATGLVEEWVELPNGCICCSVKHSFVQALEQLMQRRDRFDHILLETTGLANPGPVASVLWLDDQLESSVRLDSIITVVDAKNLDYQLGGVEMSNRTTEAYLQIAYADVIILNKVDLVNNGELEKLEKVIRDINALARIINAISCKVPLTDILDCRAYDTMHAVHAKALELNTEPNASHLQNKNFGTVSIIEDGNVDIKKVNQWLSDLLWEQRSGMEMFRVKGILQVHESEEMHVLQAVRDLYEVLPSCLWKPEERRVNKIVFIGKGLDKEFLTRSFKTCLV